MQALITFGIGIVGIIFVHKQNQILEKQNEVMRNQADLNQRQIEREDREQSEQDTLDTLEKIHLGFYATDEEIDEEIDRLLEKGLTFPQLLKRSYIATEGTMEESRVRTRVIAIQERANARRAARAASAVLLAGQRGPV